MIGKDKEILKKAMSRWGCDFQMDMVIEECSELIHAICKAKRESISTLSELTPLVDKICEEMADVKIMIAQFEEEDAYKKHIENWVEMKLQRLEERINAKKTT
jgi:NTP pyrophosphatase (non-canonical NTP hydrolase)